MYVAREQIFSTKYLLCDRLWNGILWRAPSLCTLRSHVELWPFVHKALVVLKPTRRVFDVVGLVVKTKAGT